MVKCKHCKKKTSWIKGYQSMFTEGTFCDKDCFEKHKTKSKKNNGKKKEWYKHPVAIIVYIFIGFIFFGNLLSDMEDSIDSLDVEEKEEIKIIEMSTEEIFEKFSGDLTEIQIDEIMKEFKGKRIKTSIYIDKVNKASLSSQYVVMEMYNQYPYTLFPYVKAFFPSEQKEKLLEANIGDTLIFSGEFVTFNQGSLKKGYIEFTKSKVLEIKKE